MNISSAEYYRRLCIVTLSLIKYPKHLMFMNSFYYFKANLNKHKICIQIPIFARLQLLNIPPTNYNKHHAVHAPGIY